MLHIVNKSPFEKTSLASCLRVASKGGALLLIEDGVYAVVKNSAVESALRGAMAGMPVYALQADIEARGLADRVMDGVKLVGYDGFVDLVAEHRTSQSWL
jgi:tRNA 2-thiouridine synthesizing protein B